MNTYLVHPNDTQLKSMDLHLYDNEHNKLNSFNDLSDLIESSESDIFGAINTKRNIGPRVIYYFNSFITGKNVLSIKHLK